MRQGAVLEPRIRDVVFVHLPKTGGTSVRNMLVKGYPDSVRLFDYGPDGARLGGDFLDVHALGIRSQQAVVDLRSRLPRGQAVWSARTVRSTCTTPPSTLRRS